MCSGEYWIKLHTCMYVHNFVVKTSVGHIRIDSIIGLWRFENFSHQNDIQIVLFIIRLKSLTYRKSLFKKNCYRLLTYNISISGSFQSSR